MKYQNCVTIYALLYHFVQEIYYFTSNKENSIQIIYFRDFPCPIQEIHSITFRYDSSSTLIKNLLEEIFIAAEFLAVCPRK